MAPKSSVKKVSEKVAADLHMVHNPFADTTTQPKIPDGKVNDSLGQTFTDVFELQNKVDAPIMHILMFAGKHGMLVMRNSTGELSTRGYRNQRFQNAGYVDWHTTRVALGAGTAQRLVKDLSGQGLWRIVSAGMQLKLLNSQEEDNGWFEAVRVTQPTQSGQFVLSTDDPVTPTNGNGVICPLGYLSQLETADIANDPSYSTGLLRDLHRVQFELHGKLDYHDFKQGKTTLAYDDQDEFNFDAALGQVNFNPGSSEVMEIADNFIDESYDMVYLRLHCRENDGSTTAGSKLHCHVTSNQEISYAQSNVLNRFQTKNDSVGESIMGIHFQGRRNMGNAATLIV